jgi:glycosyltransferase involved in cell wall biosynthesis
MEKKYIVTVDLDLPPLRSGVKPYFAFAQFPFSNNAVQKLNISLQRLLKLLKWARHSEIMVLDSTSGPLQPDMLACTLFHFFNKKPIVVMTGDMWNKGNRLEYRFRKTMIHLADTNIQRYVVQSLGEQQIFAKMWGIAPEKVRLCLYNFTFTDEEINAGKISAKGYIFAGGNPNRDYDLLLETARRLPNRRFIIATRVLDGRNDIPSNVKVVQVPHLEFIRLMRESDAVVTPIRSGVMRAAGQQTYLNAMRMGKISIVNGKDVFGVTDYIQNYVNGIIIDGTPLGCSEAIEWVYNPANQSTVKKIQQLAQESVMQFTYERHIHTMASIIEEAVAKAGI